ncbi:uncharacterized protein PV09_01911 [Verruconis gallopava]|uniref:F-box domain-containing protein n=1 Tax=Verruconis gallopava TaxID=253628 RepID=A0A0D1XWB7_9PEZI|nr:uncharacterized protein PV09_01911 [Verruconis gallopava]KIW07016.1 hypothetical protein PV09_01911 [Verruconis gallopava]
MPKRKRTMFSSHQLKRRKVTRSGLIEQPIARTYPENSFLGLPAELRIAIFFHVFHTEPGKDKDLQVLLTCRRFYHDAYALAYLGCVLKINGFETTDQISARMLSLRKLSPYFRSSIKTIQFWHYKDIGAILRSGIFQPTRLIDMCPMYGILSDLILRVLYDLACSNSSSKVDYILSCWYMRPVPIIGRSEIESARNRIVSDSGWKKKLMHGIMKRYEEIRVGEICERGVHVSLGIEATRLDGSHLQFRVMTDDVSVL